MKKHLPKLLFWSTGLVILAISAGWLVSSVMWAFGQNELAFRVFPLHFSRAKTLAQDSTASKDTQELIQTLYFYHPEMIKSMAQFEPDHDQRLRFYLQMLSIYPYQWEVRKMVLQQATAERRFQVFLDQVKDLEKYYPGKKFDAMPVGVLSTVKSNIFLVSNLAIDQDQKLAQELYLIGAKHWPWMMDGAPTPFLQEPQRFPKTEILSFLQNLDHHYLWSYQSSLVLFYLKEAESAIASSNYDKVDFFVNRVVELAPWRKQEVWLRLAHMYEEQYRANLLQRKYSQAEQGLRAWQVLFSQLEKSRSSSENVVLDLSTKLKLGSAYIELGNTLAKQDIDEAVELVTEAQVIAPELAMQNTFFYSQNNDPKLAEDIFKAVLRQRQLSVWMNNYQFAKTMQLAANNAIREERWVDVEQYLQFMKTTLLQDYWAPAQLGNFFYLKGELEQATQAYRSCLELRAQHQIQGESGCQDGLHSIEANWQDDASKLYWRGSQAILKYR